MMQKTPLVIGLLVLAAAWSGGFDRWAPGPFSAHMSVHIAVVAIAAPLIAAAVAGGTFDPARVYPGAFAPIAASIVELIVVWAWHVPAPHEAARTHSIAYGAEQATFLASGLLLWLAAVGGPEAAGGARGGAGVAALVFTSMHMTLLGALFALTPRALYGAHHGTGPAAIADQHLGGVIMLLVGGGAYLCGGLWLTGRLLRHASQGVEVRP